MFSLVLEVIIELGILGHCVGAQARVLRREVHELHGREGLQEDSLM